MEGTVTSYNVDTGELVVEITSTVGTGTYSSWIITSSNEIKDSALDWDNWVPNKTIIPAKYEDSDENGIVIGKASYLVHLGDNQCSSKHTPKHYVTVQWRLNPYSSHAIAGGNCACITNVDCGPYWDDCGYGGLQCPEARRT